jgi:hypothetical protein
MSRIKYNSHSGLLTTDDKNVGYLYYLAAGSYKLQVSIIVNNHLHLKINNEYSLKRMRNKIITRIRGV